MDIRTKRIYEDPQPDDGTRVLVDRLWPRGVSKEDAQLDAWLKSIAPTDDLREWYDHDAERWDRFRRAYWRELEDAGESVEELRTLASSDTVTLLYAATNRERNNAVVLQEFLEERGL